MQNVKKYYKTHPIEWDPNPATSTIKSKGEQHMKLENDI